MTNGVGLAVTNTQTSCPTTDGETALMCHPSQASGCVAASECGECPDPDNKFPSEISPNLFNTHCCIPVDLSLGQYLLYF